MGREVRMVPADWVHPRDWGGHYVPKLSESYRSAKQRWDDFDEEKEGYTHDGYFGHADPPDPDDYMPEFEPGTATHLMMYENTSEGTPISPAFATPGKLARWLADTGASSFANMTATYEQWLSVCRGGYAPSAVAVGGRLMSGVEAMVDGDSEE